MSNKIKFVPLPLLPSTSRATSQLREVDYRMGLVSEATGSCWYSAGSGAYSTKVCCCVLGPKPVKQVSLTGTATLQPHEPLHLAPCRSHCIFPPAPAALLPQRHTVLHRELARHP